MVVLNGNPLVTIRNAADICSVMKVGVRCDGNTLDQIWPQAKAFPRPYWYLEGVQASQPMKR